MCSAWLGEGERVYVHCRAGWQRSATIVAAIVALREGVRRCEALHILRARKPRRTRWHISARTSSLWWERALPS